MGRALLASATQAALPSGSGNARGSGFAGRPCDPLAALSPWPAFQMRVAVLRNAEFLAGLQLASEAEGGQETSRGEGVRAPLEGGRL